MITKENCPNLKCIYCKFSPHKNPHACKRIPNFDILRFAKSPFNSDIYFNPNGICSDFVSDGTYKWLDKHWTNFEDYFGIYEVILNESFINPPTRRTVGIKIVGEPNVVYKVLYKDFVYGTMIEGNRLKATNRFG